MFRGGCTCFEADVRVSWQMYLIKQCAIVYMSFIPIEDEIRKK